MLATAEVVLTLTPGAADEIADRFGRTAIVVAHPSAAVPDPALGAERGLVGLRLGAPAPACPRRLGARARGAVGRGLRRGPAAGARRRRAPCRPARCASWPTAATLELVVHAAGERAAQLQQLHVAVLPGAARDATRRDLEICRDVGTRVVAPSCGWSAEQWSEVVSYGTDAAAGWTRCRSPAAVAAALTRPMPRPADRALARRAAGRRPGGCTRRSTGRWRPTAPDLTARLGTPRGGRDGLSGMLCGQGRGRTADLSLFRRALVPTELPAPAGDEHRASDPDGTRTRDLRRDRAAR